MALCIVCMYTMYVILIGDVKGRTSSYNFKDSSMKLFMLHNFLTALSNYLRTLMIMLALCRWKNEYCSSTELAGG